MCNEILSGLGIGALVLLGIGLFVGIFFLIDDYTEKNNRLNRHRVRIDELRKSVIPALEHKVAVIQEELQTLKKGKRKHE